MSLKTQISILIVFLFARQMPAATLTWNSGSSFWNTTNTNWTGSAWSEGSDAVFSGTSGTVTIDGAPTPAFPNGVGPTVNSLQFSTSGYTLSGPTVTISGGDVKTTAELALTTINSNLIFNTTGGIITNSGKNSSHIMTLNGTIDNGGNTLTVKNLKGIVNLNGSISGSGGLVVGGINGVGIGINLKSASSNSNSFTGDFSINNNVTVNASSIAASGDNSSLGAGHNIVFLNGGGVINFNQSSDVTSNRTIDLRNTSATNGINSNGVGGIDFSGSIVANLGGTSHILALGGTSASTNNKVGGNLSDRDLALGRISSITKSGAGYWALYGNSTFTGTTTISAGVINVQSDNALGSTAGGTSVAGGAALQIQGNIIVGAETLTLGGTGVSNDGALRNISGTNTYGGLVSLASAARINSDSGTLTLSNAGIITGSGLNLTLGGAGNTTVASIIGTGAGSLTKDGTGTLTLTGTNTYTGGTNLSAGTLNFTTGGLGTTGAVTFTGNSTLQYGSSTTTDLSSRLVLNTGVTGTVDTNGNNVTFASGFGASGSGALTKTGSGTLTLTGANTYTGTTTVSAGTLTLHAASGSTLANTTAVVVATGATVSLSAASQINSAATLTLNGGTLALNGFNQTLGTLDLNAASALNLSGSDTLVFADSSALDWNSATFSVSHFQVGTTTLRFGTTSGGLTSTQLGLVRFVEFGNSTALINASGFLAPTSSNYLNTSSSDLTIATPITGTTTVDQTGSGSFTLTGVNTSSGAAAVTAGTLLIGTAAGGNWAGSVTVSGTGTLKGSGDISGAVVVNSAGTYSPGNSPAIQHIGSLSLDSGGFVTIELDGAKPGTGAGFHDQIISAGAVTLNSGTLNAQTIFTGSRGYQPKLGAFHSVITGTAVTGTFTAYNFTSNAAGFSFLPEYTATAVNLYAVPSNYATDVAGLNTNQTQVGAALQSLRLSRSAFELDQRTPLDSRSVLFNGLKTKDPAGLRTAYDQLTPEKLTALPAATFQSASILNSSLHQRSAEIRRFGFASVSLNGVATPAAAEDYSMATVIEGGVRHQIAKVKPKNHFGYFAAATGAFATVDGSADRLGSFSQTGAATGGVDYAINDRQTVGLVVSQALADTDFSSNSGSARTTTSRVGVFHDYHNGGFFLNTAVSAGFSTYDTKRNISFLNQTASGETQGVSYGGQLSTGYDFKVGEYIMGPTASVAYDHAHINGFDETGSAADLRVGRQNADSLITKMGVHVSRPFIAKNIGWIPDVSLSASRQSFNPNSITARLAAGGDAFRVTPQAGGSEFINPSASLSALLPNGWTVRLSYDAILNPQSAEHRVNLSVGAGF
jgi:autotransporter-associated beta strand protein